MTRSRVYRTEAIILKRTSLGEADYIYTLYTPNLGKVRALAKGVKRMKSRIAGHVEPLNHSSLMLARGRNLDVITQGQTIDSFQPLKGDLWLTACALYADELVDAFTGDGIEVYPLFRLLLDVPWTTRLSTLRPPLGPGQLAKYEYELAAFDGAGLDDVTVDDALTYLLGFVRNAALDVQAAEDIAAADGRTDGEWWAHAGPVLADLVSPERYPRAARIGAAAGAARGSAHDPAHAYRFGLDLTIDAIAMRRSG